MRSLLAAVVLAFLSSWAIAEWPRTTRRVHTASIDNIVGDALISYPFHFQLLPSTIIESSDGTPIARQALTPGQSISATSRCAPNTVPSCTLERIRVLNDAPRVQ